MLMRKRNAILRSMEHLRDVSPRSLGVSPAEIYRVLQRLPRQLTRRGALRLLGEHRDRLEEVFATHRHVGEYRLRDVAMYGIAECHRSEMFTRLLAGGRLGQLGELMRVSHDGDRVARYRDGRAVRHGPLYSDARLDRLIRDAASEDARRREAAALWAQPGRYACSTPEIDCMVDLACAQAGVVGAQLAGPGLGGCAMVLVRSESLRPLLTALRNGYYVRRRLPFDVHVCQPVAGSGILSV
ncbi:MAG: hypothetical protein AMJ81_01925 [Phycisphaerae bacterium SM23_33]|nr:MAG: hypothetical protein AMJ81_01925 [Phycisphaerae bacterium SM23_33]